MAKDLAERERALREVTQALAAHLDEGRVLALTAQHAVKLLDAPYGRLRLLDPDGWLSCAAAEGYTYAETLTRRLPPESLSGLVLDAGVLNLGDVRSHPAWGGTREGRYAHNRAYLGAAMRRAGTVLGVLEVLRDGKRPFTEADEQLLTGLADAAAVAVDNARLYRAVQEELRERQKAEEALRISERKHRLLIEEAVEGILVFGPEGRMLIANPRACQILGRPREELLRLGIHDLTELLGLPRLEELQVAQVSKRVELRERRLHRRDGVDVHIEVSAQLLEDGHVQAFVRDVTERNRAHAALRAAESENARLAQEAARAHALEHLNRLQQEFISIASHELRTPMTSILGVSEVLLDQMAPDDPRREYMTLLHADAERLRDLANDLLDVSRLDSGAVLIEAAVVDVREILRPLVQSLRLRSSRHAISCTCDGRVPPVLADAGKLQQILGNLLSNAVKYSPLGGAITVHLGEDTGTGQVVVAVADQGMGIPPEHRERIF